MNRRSEPSCDFDDDFCGWENITGLSSRNTHWQRSNGKTDENIWPGPGDEYAFIKKIGSRSYLKGDIKTTKIPSSWGDFCVNLNYYLSDGKDTLEIYHILNNDPESIGECKYISTEWQKCDITFTTDNTSGAENYIKFHGETYTNIVAINNVNISKGACQDSPVTTTTDFSTTSLMSTTSDQPGDTVSVGKLFTHVS
ncbi:uncharacterized protein [Antedon mediterranea]|uniref:uncharacterized protein n=1 Tax=Antedon mediterranea TaxID=105859 RepID=UPI003AF77F80